MAPHPEMTSAELSGSSPAPPEAASTMTNRHGTTIEVGQRWADNDPRCHGRILRIVGFDADLKKAQCLVIAEAGADAVLDNPSKTVKILIDRLHPTSSGYRLLND